MKRHKWGPDPIAPDRADLRVCARSDCGMHRRDYGETRYEYRVAGTHKFIANQKKTWPAPPCGANKPGPNKETNT